MRRPRPRVTILATELGRKIDGKGKYADQVLRRLLPLLSAAGCRVSIIAPRDATLPAGSARVYLLPAAKDRATWRVLGEHLFLPLSWPSDVFLSLNGALPLVPVLARRRLVVVHDIHPLLTILRRTQGASRYSLQSLLFNATAMWWGVHAATCLLPVSRSSAAEVARLFDLRGKRVRLARCGVDHTRFESVRSARSLVEVRRRLGLPAEYYLFVGSPTDDKKNFALVHRAYARAPVGTGWRLPVVLVGADPGHGLPSEKFRSDGAMPFMSVGHVAEEDLPALYAGARALLQPSHHEGFGIPALEAMACGTPVVVSDLAAMPEVVGAAGFAVDPASPSSLAAALRRLESPDLRAAQSREGKRRARIFTWDATARVIASEILGSPCSAPPMTHPA